MSVPASLPTTVPHTPLGTGNSGQQPAALAHPLEKQDSAQATNTTVERERTSAYHVSISSQHSYQNSSLTYSRFGNDVSGASETNNTEKTAETAAVENKAPTTEGAKNILGFIEQRLATELSEGASEEELKELLQQGLEGFAQGYGEAMDMLAETGGINAAVNQAVGTLYQEVLEGVDALYERFLGEAPSKADSAVANNTITSTTPSTPLSFTNPLESFDQPAIDFSQLLDVDPLSELIEATTEYSRKDSFAFELTTTDGDTISIGASSFYSFAQNYSSSYNANSQSAFYSEESVSNSRFHFSVEGELDAGEVAAIEELLGQVFALADDFYQGDVEAAYAAALEIGYDSEEITGYSLNLKQTETYQVAAAYQQLNPEAELASPENHHALKGIQESIGSYTQNILESLNNPANYKHVNYSQLIENISKQLDAQISHANDENRVSFSDTIAQLTQPFTQQVTQPST